MSTITTGLSRRAIAIALGLLAVSAFFITSQYVKAAPTFNVDPTFVDQTGCDVPVLGYTYGVDCFPSVAAAVMAAAGGETINVAPGTYIGNVVIANGVTLQGANASTTIIDGQITVNASNTSISGFTVTNTGGSFGILVNAVNNVTITGNTVDGVGTTVPLGVNAGIYFQDENSTSNSNFVVTNNTVTNIGSGTNGTNQGIGIGDSTGSGVFTGFIVSGNNISNVSADPTPTSPGKGAYGIQVNHAGTGHTGSTSGIQITNNTISGLNGRWVHAIDLEGNTPSAVVTGNSVSNLSAFATYSGLITDGAGVFFQANPSISTVTLSMNSFDTTSMPMGVALHSSQTGALNAEQNFWNTGTTNPSSKIGVGGGSVDSNPWYTDAALTTLIAPPSIAIDPFTTPTNDATPSFSFSSNSMLATFDCSIDGLATTSLCGPVFTAGSLSEGAHTFTVVVTDTASLLTNSASTAFTVDTVAPTVTSITTADADGYYGFGDTVTFTVTFSEAVAVSGTPSIALNSGGQADYTGGSGSDTLTFVYTVGFQTSNDLAHAATGSLSGTIADAATNAAVLTLPDPSLFEAAHAIIADGVAPTLAQVTAVATPRNDTTPTYVFSSDEDGTLMFVSGACVATSTAVVAGTNAATFLTSTSPETGFTDGTYACPIKVVDAAGNESNTINSPGTFTIDTTAPVVNSVVAAPGAGSYGPNSLPLTITVNFNEYVTSFDPLTITFNNGATCTTTIPGGTTVSCTYQPALGDDIADLSVSMIETPSQIWDSAFNDALLSPIVNLVAGIEIDTVSPVITLSGTDPDSTPVGTPYTDPGATTDDGSTVIASGSVDETVVGTYTLSYDATDAAGNDATTVTRSVYVLPDANAPSMLVATTTNLDGSVSGTIPADVTLGGGTLFIPANTVITGSSTWNGEVLAPIGTSTLVDPTSIDGLTLGTPSSIEAGSLLSTLLFSQPVTLTFKNKIGHYVGFSLNGSFTHILTTCPSGLSISQLAAFLGTFGECKFNSGNSLVVETTHLTTFTTFSVTPNGSGSSSGGGGGGGGNGSPLVLSSTNTGSTPSTGGEVLGETTYNFTRDLRIGSTGEDVTALQELLIAEGYMSGSATGYFGNLTSAAVKLYQKAHGIMQTGTVGPLTRAQLNGSASGSTQTGTPALSKTQADAIIGLLLSFGADQSVIDSVKKALGY